MQELRKRPMQLLTAAAIVVGVAGGSYAIAGAATGSGSTTTTTTAAAPTATGPPAFDASQPWGSERSDETLLTGDTATEVEAAARRVRDPRPG